MLNSQAQRSEGTEATRLYSESVSAYREALKVTPRKALPQDWAGIQRNLGAALTDQADRGEGKETPRKRLREPTLANLLAFKNDTGPSCLDPSVS